MEKCIKCNSTVEKWNEYKDSKRKYTILVAAPQFFINTAWRSASSGLTAHLFKHDLESDELYFCKSCKRYFLQCPNCKTYTASPVMLTELASVLTCDTCGKRVMYGVPKGYSH